MFNKRYAVKFGNILKILGESADGFWKFFIGKLWDGQERTNNTWFLLLWNCFSNRKNI